MKDEGSWIYFLVVIILSIIGSLKKKKNVRGPYAPQEEEDEIPPVEFPVFSPVVVSPEAKKETPSPTIKSRIESEGESVFELDNKNEPESGKQIALTESLGLKLRDADELKRGIIYSEILNRKYF